MINAEDDPYANPTNMRGMAERFPDARLVVLPDGGHELLGHAAEVKTEVPGSCKSMWSGWKGVIDIPWSIRSW